MNGKKTVAVIGSGFSGLAAVKQCLEEGLAPTCFEMHDNIGGVWYETEELRPGQGPRTYDSLVTNSSKEMMCFSDYPFPKEYPTYLTAPFVHEYLCDYANHFCLNKHIHLNTKVSSVERASDYDKTGRWQVTTEDGQGRETTLVFDFVMICTGFYRIPHYPKVPGMERFQGFKHHSQDFKTGRVYQNKRVLVVGNANSAGDCAADTGDFAEQVYLSVGPGCWILTRMAHKGTPRDFLHRRALLKMPEAIVNKIVMKEANAKIDHENAGLRPDKPPLSSIVMISDDIQMKIMSGKVKVIGRLTRLGTNSAYMDDGTVIEDLDGIIFATGFDKDLSFLKDEAVGGNNEKLEFFKMAFPVHLPHKSLALIGCLSTVGAHPPVFELQARIAARVFAGRHKLPPKDVMMQDIEKWNKFVKEKTGYYKYKFPTVPMREDLAKELGVQPRFWNLVWSDPKLAFQCMFGPAFPVQYRLTGPGAWEGARKACDDAYDNSMLAMRHRKVPPMQSNGKGSKLPKFLSLSLVAVIFLSFIFLTILQ